MILFRIKYILLIVTVYILGVCWPISATADEGNCVGALTSSLEASVDPRANRQVDVNAALTFIRVFGLRWTESELFQKGGAQAAVEMGSRVSEPLRKVLAPLFDQLKAGELSLTEFHKRIYFAYDPIKRESLYLAFLGASHSDNDHLYASKSNFLNNILLGMPKILTNGPFGRTSTSWLPGLFKVAEIKVEDSLSPSRKHGLNNPGKMVSVVLWIGSEINFGESALIDIRQPRVVVTGKLDGNRFEVATVEIQIFGEDVWTPHLYEHRNGRLEKVFETADRVHSVQRCVSCHGSGDSFSPIPFKFRRDYEPAPGWFDKKVVNDEPPGLNFGFWSIRGGASNTYNSIKEYIFDWSKHPPKDDELQEISKRLSNREEVKVRYSDEHEYPVTWSFEWQEGHRFWRSRAPEKLREFAMKLKKEVAAGSTDHGFLVAILSGEKIIFEPYTQSGSDMTSLVSAAARLEKQTEGKSVLQVHRQHFRGVHRPAVWTPEEFAIEREIAKPWRSKNIPYISDILFNGQNGQAMGFAGRF